MSGTEELIWFLISQKIMTCRIIETYTDEKFPYRNTSKLLKAKVQVYIYIHWAKYPLGNGDCAWVKYFNVMAA